MYLKKKGGTKFLLTGIPCFLMLIITAWAMIKNEINFIESQNWLLTSVGAGLFILAAWITIETLILFYITPRPHSQEV